VCDSDRRVVIEDAESCLELEYGVTGGRRLRAGVLAEERVWAAGLRVRGWLPSAPLASFFAFLVHW